MLPLMPRFFSSAKPEQLYSCHCTSLCLQEEPGKAIEGHTKLPLADATVGQRIQEMLDGWKDKPQQLTPVQARMEPPQATVANISQQLGALQVNVSQLAEVCRSYLAGRTINLSD